MNATATSPACGQAARSGAGGAAVARRAAAGDRAALERMFARCTVQTRYRRFHAPVTAIPARYLTEALSGSLLHYALVAGPAAPASGIADIVALASCRLLAAGRAEVGLLVEDGWQRRGLGLRLLDDLVTHASGTGVRVLEAQLLAEQSWIAGLLDRYGRCRLHSSQSGVVLVTVSLDGASCDGR